MLASHSSPRQFPREPASPHIFRLNSSLRIQFIRFPHKQALFGNYNHFPSELFFLPTFIVKLSLAGKITTPAFPPTVSVHASPRNLQPFCLALITFIHAALSAFFNHYAMITRPINERIDIPHTPLIAASNNLAIVKRYGIKIPTRIGNL